MLFTADPVTGRRRHAVIDAGPGLGEAVVSGAVNPDHFVVDTATGDGSRGGEAASYAQAAPTVPAAMAVRPTSALEVLMAPMMGPREIWPRRGHLKIASRTRR